MKRLAMGIYDDLDNQTQPLLYVSAAGNNMIVFGGHQSGKTTFLKTLLVRMHENLERQPRLLQGLAPCVGVL